MEGPVWANRDIKDSTKTFSIHKMRMVPTFFFLQQLYRRIVYMSSS